VTQDIANEYEEILKASCNLRAKPITARGGRKGYIMSGNSFANYDKQERNCSTYTFMGLDKLFGGRYNNHFFNEIIGMTKGPGQTRKHLPIQHN